MKENIVKYLKRAKKLRNIKNRNEYNQRLKGLKMKETSRCSDFPPNRDILKVRLLSLRVTFTR